MGASMNSLGWAPALIWLIAVLLVLGTVAAICEEPARRRYHRWRYRRAQARRNRDMLVSNARIYDCKPAAFKGRNYKGAEF